MAEKEWKEFTCDVCNKDSGPRDKDEYMPPGWANLWMSVSVGGKHVRWRKPFCNNTWQDKQEGFMGLVCSPECFTKMYRLSLSKKTLNLVINAMQEETTEDKDCCQEAEED